MILKFPLLIVSCLVPFGALASLCSNDVFDNKCLCKKFTDESRNLPASLANCNGLGLVKFPDFKELPDDITILDVSMNNIQALESVNSSTLKKLLLNHNEIVDVRDGFFTGLPDLRVLDLSYNNLTNLSDNVFVMQKKLVYLDLSYNNIKQLPNAVFEPMPLLQHLDLSYNYLGEFLTTYEHALSRTLGISPNLSSLGLNSVGLYDVHPSYFEAFEQLTHLELKDNAFAYIPTLPYSLEYLDFSGNNLSFVSARYLNYHSLKVLRLSRMPSLSSIHHYAFYNLQALETLILTDCPNVEEFTDLAFGKASKTTDVQPKTLILARNGIRKLNSSYKHMFRKMEHIDLRHNPWTCDCDILWIQEFSAELFKGREMRCASPNTLKRKRILDLKHLDLPDCFPEIYGKVTHRIIIVVLMTTVILLMGLIFYLVKYPKCWVSPKHIGISLTSPYSQAPQEDVRF